MQHLCNTWDCNQEAPRKTFTSSKTPVLPFFIAEPEEVIFNEYTLHKTHQKKLKLRNGSRLPAVIDKLDVNPQGRFQIKMSEKDLERRSVASGMCVIMLVEFTPHFMEEVEGSITVKTCSGRSTMVKVAAYRKHPCLASHAIKKWPQPSSYLSVFNCGRCLVGSSIILQKHIKNFGGGGQFILIKDDFFWDDLKIKELFQENNKIVKGPFTITPASFSVKENSEINFICEFSPSKSGIHIENIVVASDMCSLQELTLEGEGLNYEPHLIFLKDSEKNFNITIEDDANAGYYLDMGEMLPFTSKSKKINVMNNCEIAFNYRWETRKAVIDTLCHPPYLDSTKSFWSVSPDVGRLKPKINEFSVQLSLKDSPFGKYRHVISLILEGIPEKCLASAEVLKMKTTRGSSETQRNGLVNAVVAEVELWAECIPLKLEIHPPFIFQPTPIMFDKPFTTQATIFNHRDVHVYCSWNIDEIITEGERSALNDIKWEAKITPFEACLIPHGIQKFSVTIQIKFLNKIISGNIVPLTFSCKTWYEACNSNTEKEFQLDNGIKHCKVVGGPLLKSYFLGRIEDAKVKIVDSLASDKAYDIEFDFGMIHSDLEIKKKIFLQNLSNQKATCQMALFKDEENSTKLMINNSADCDKIFSISHNFMVIGNKSTEKAILKFHPKAEESYSQLIVASVDGTQPGPSWDFALTTGIGGVPSVVLNPSTSIDKPYKVTKAWAGTMLKLPGEDFFLKNVSCHPSLLATFRWSDPIGEEASQLQVAIHPNSGIIRPQDVIHFSITMIFNSKRIQDFTLPCFIGKRKDPLLLYFKSDVESPRISFRLPEEEAEGYAVDDIIAMGLADKKMMTKDNNVAENKMWSSDYPDNTVISFKDVPTYKVEVRRLSIENKSPFDLRFVVKLKNFAGKVHVQKFNKWKCSIEEHQVMQKEGHLGLGNFLSANTTITEVKPSKGILSPWEKSTIEIWLIASTWGFYLEEVTVEFHEVTWESQKAISPPPSFTMICIANITSHPIHFPAMIKNENKIMRFGTVTGQNQERQRTICVRNTSCIDIIIVWQTHLRSSHQERLPFQIVFHSFNSNVFQRIKQNNDQSHNRINPRKINYTNEILNKIDVFLMKQMEGGSQDDLMEIGILPTVGPRNDEAFKVDPLVTIMPPHSERNLTITFKCGNYIQSCKKFHGTLVGYVHVSPENSFSPGHFERLQGTKLEPALLTMEAFQAIPKLLVSHEKDKSEMKVYVQKLLMDKIELETTSFRKALILQNKSDGNTNFQMHVDEPFVLSVDHESEVKVQRLGPNSAECMIPPERKVEIIIKYDLTRNVFDWALEFMRVICDEESRKKLLESTKFDVTTDNERHVTINKKLSIRQNELTVKIIPLQIVFLFPSISLSTKCIDFGSVMINSSKTYKVTVKNNSDEVMKFSTSVEQKSGFFSARPKDCLIHGNKDYADSFATVYVTLKPKRCENYNGTLIITLIKGVKEIPIELSGHGFEEDYDGLILNEM